MVPGRDAPSISTGVPRGCERAMQPFVSVLPSRLEQCAAWPMNTFVPSVKMKFAVHCDPPVKVWTPGVTVAVSAGAHAGAAEAGEDSVGSNDRASRRATSTLQRRDTAVIGGVLCIRRRG